MEPGPYSPPGVPEKKRGMHGCLLVGIACIVLLLGLLSYCGLSLYRVATQDIPAIKPLTASFVKSYDANDYDAIYDMTDAAFRASVTKEKNAEQASHIKTLTGSITLGDQVGWNAQNFNGQQYVSISYQCTSDKGALTLTMKYHQDTGWKLMSYNVNVR